MHVFDIKTRHVFVKHGCHRRQQSQNMANTLRGGSRTSTAGGAQVTNEAEGFTEARSAERGREGEGVTPPAGGGPGASPGNFLRNCIKMVHSECILR